MTDLISSLITSPLIIVDIGADGGVHEIEGLSAYSEVHAFEPRKEPFDELVSGEAEHDGKAYKKMNYHNCALAGEEGEYDLYITKSPRASSFLEPDMTVVTRARGENDQTFIVMGKEKVKAIRLATFMTDAKIDWVDYLKIDTQGTELDILIGSKEVLPKISVIMMEVEFIPLYKNQPLFGECVSKLWEQGFRLLDLPIIATTTGEPMGKKVYCEAVFVNDRLCPDQEKAIKRALVLCDLGYVHDANWCMADHGVQEQTIKDITDVFFASKEAAYANVALNAIRYVQKTNAQRRAQGKASLNFQLVKKLMMKTSLGRKLMNTVNLNISTNGTRDLHS